MVGLRRWPFLSHLLKRVLVLIPLLLSILFLVFALVRIGPTNPAVLIAGPVATEVEIEAIERELLLDQPIVAQFGHYVASAFQGDLGESWVTNRPVTEEIRNRLPITLELATLGTATSLLFGLLIGYWAAMKEGKVIDHLSRVVTLGGISIPIFWLALLLIYWFFTKLSWAPAPLGRIDTFVSPPERVFGSYLIDGLLTGDMEAVRSAAGRLVLPIVAITLVTGATIAKQTRASIVEVKRTASVRFARASGLKPRHVRAHIVRNALPSIITFVGIAYSLLLGGVALVEIIFSWGGLAQFGVESVTRADWAVVQGFVLTMGLLAALVYLLSDILVSAIDPRVRYE